MAMRKLEKRENAKEMRKREIEHFLSTVSFMYCILLMHYIYPICLSNQIRQYLIVARDINDSGTIKSIVVFVNHSASRDQIPVEVALRLDPGHSKNK